MEKLTVIETFSGVGCQIRGIENSHLFDAEVIATSEIDKNAILAYAAVHKNLTDDMIENYKYYPSRQEMAEYLSERNIGYDFTKNKAVDWFKMINKKTKELEKMYLACVLTNNLGDISKVQELPYADLLTFSFPCQSISIAGKQEGIKEGETRSGLVYEIVRLLRVSEEKQTLPKYLLLENVSNLVGKKFIKDFENLNNFFDELGYNVYYKVLNAKECGIPQNRCRVFGIYIRKDIDTKKFTFPKPFDNGLRLKDILEKDVEEKYYINTERASNLIQQLIDKGQLKGQRECADSTINDPNTREISNCITARYDASIQNQKQIGLVVCEPNAESKRLGGMFDDETKHQAGSVWDKDGLAPTLDTMQGGHRQPCIIEEKDSKPIWKPLGKTQYMISNHGSVADTSTKQKVEPFEEDGEIKVKLSINGIERVSTVKALVDKLFPNTDNDPQFVIGSTQKNAYVGDGSIAPTLTSAMGMGGGHVAMIGFENTAKPICVGNTTPSGKSQCNAVYSTDGVSQTLCAGTHGYATGSILEEQKTLVRIKQATKQGYIECEVPGVADLSFPNSDKRRGRVQGNGQICPTLMAGEPGLRYFESLYRIRKLTPSECWVLMGLTKEDCMKAANLGISNSALYKIAGNGIVTNCIKLIAEHLFKAQYDSTYICTDENFQKPQVD